jgi:hypothetical protein
MWACRAHDKADKEALSESWLSVPSQEPPPTNPSGMFRWLVSKLRANGGVYVGPLSSNSNILHTLYLLNISFAVSFAYQGGQSTLVRLCSLVPNLP